MLRGNQLLNMEALHNTRVADKRVCTCWKGHKAEMTNLAFDNLNMADPNVIEVMKGWVMNGDTCPEAGDKLYDLLWLDANHCNSYNKYFIFSKIENHRWLDVVLLRPVCGYPPYTSFDCAHFDMEKLELVFTSYKLDDVIQISLHYY
jgi:hypothetical protein